MTTRARGALWCAGLLAAGCATTQRGTSSDPGARQVALEQEQSERALEGAQRAQQRATDQARKAAQADQDVQELQRRLAEARERARVERQKAQQFQQEANLATECATAQARESQQQAQQALARETERARRGEQAISGQVLRAAPGELVVRQQGSGEAMTFRITDQTRVLIGGRSASATDLRQGEDARVAWRVSGTEATATEVQVMRSQADQGSAGTSAPQGTTAPPPAQEPGTQR